MNSQTSDNRPVSDSQLEELLLDFDRGWTPEALSKRIHALPQEGPGFRRVAIAELVKIDLERQWARGQRVGLEAYLKKLPELGTPDSVNPDLIRAEYEARRSAGESPDLHRFARRFPHQWADLRRLLKREAGRSTRH